VIAGIEQKDITAPTTELPIDILIGDIRLFTQNDIKSVIHEGTSPVEQRKQRSITVYLTTSTRRESLKRRGINE
jgi:hypothetical protein|tara:strand:+ start:401 stop:622 length:222 start_codon:yes stop_codon:yes gene_type:complete